MKHRHCASLSSGTDEITFRQRNAVHDSSSGSDDIGFRRRDSVDEGLQLVHVRHYPRCTRLSAAPPKLTISSPLASCSGTGIVRRRWLGRVFWRFGEVLVVLEVFEVRLGLGEAGVATMAQACCSCGAGAVQASAAAALVRPECGSRGVGERASALAFPKAGVAQPSQKASVSASAEQLLKSAFFQGAAAVGKDGAAQRRNAGSRGAGPSAGRVRSVLSEERGMENMTSVAVKEADVTAPDAIESRVSSGKTLTAPVPKDFVSRYADDEPRKGSDILVEALEREGVRTTFAYPGGASMEIHQALTRSVVIRNVLCRHEQGEIFAAEGYAKSSGRVGVCIATSGPGATNLVTGLADALLDSVPLVAITGQVPRRFIGTDAFQETPIVEVTRSITKHNYLVLTVDDIPRVIREAFFLAASGRPGPVLVDIPKDIQQQLAIPDWNQPMRLHSYLSRLPPPPQVSLMQQIIRLLATSKKPVVYSGGGCLHASKELREFVELTGIPVTSTLMGLGTFPASDERYLSMLGMHGTVYANYAIDQADLLLAFGVRFDDRVTGKLESFASRASIVHVDIDPAEIGKNKQPHVSICADVQLALAGLNKLIKEGPATRPDYSAWRAELDGVKLQWPMKFPKFESNVIVPQSAIQTLCEMTGGNAIISTGVGQHQMWAAQWYDFEQPRRWLTSGGLGAMGFGLPAALGAASTNPDIPVVDIDGDGSFIMNIQELATIHVEKLPVKIMILNNQHLGMVVQWEDRFYKANRAHTYLGDPEAEAEIYPDFCKIAEGCKVPSARVTRKEDLRDAIAKMLETPGPYLLDVIVPHQEHVLPMIPGGASFKEIITEGDGRQQY